MFYLNNADNVTISDVSITGAEHGIHASTSSGSDFFTLRNSEVYGNSRHGVYLETSNDDTLFENNVIRNHSGDYGLYLRGWRNEISGGEFFANRTSIYINAGGASIIHNTHIYDNEYDGIYTSTNSTMHQVYDNVVHDNGRYGIHANNGTIVRDNLIYGHDGDTGDTGVYASGSSRVEYNEVYNNYRGVMAHNWGRVLDNDIYGNYYGLMLYADGTPVTGNRIFDNAIGIYSGFSYWESASIINNLIYDNTTWGLILGNGDYHEVRNNIIYQPAGSAIRLTNGVSYANIRNNVIYIGDGYAINVDSDSQVGFASDYNMFWLGADGLLGTWEGLDFPNQVDWFYELGFDQHSVLDDPLLADIDGIDDLLGFSMDSIGGAMIVDNGDAGFVSRGTWDVQSDRGYGGTQLTSAAGQGDTVTWTFPDVVAGTYRIAATWIHGNSYNYANNTRYRVYDGDELVI